MNNTLTLEKYMTIENYRLVENHWGKHDFLPVPGVFILAKDRSLAVLLAGISGDFMDLKKESPADHIPALEQGFLNGSHTLN